MIKDRQFKQIQKRFGGLKDSFDQFHRGLQAKNLTELPFVTSSAGPHIILTCSMMNASKWWEQKG